MLVAVLRLSRWNVWTYICFQVEKSRQLLESRLRADQEASSPIPARNRVSAPTLSTLLDRRKSVGSQEEVDALVQKYGLDPAKFEAISRYVNSPSIQGGSALKTVGKDGEENVSVLVSEAPRMSLILAYFLYHRPSGWHRLTLPQFRVEMGLLSLCSVS